MTWLSPSFPVGGYSYSHGLEYAVEAGYVTDAPSLQNWVSHILMKGSGFLDAVILSETWDAVAREDVERFVHVAERSAANRATSEMALESTAQGDAFFDAVNGAWHVEGLETWTAMLSHKKISATYPVMVGLAAALHGVAQAPTVLAYLHASASNFVAAGMRLVPLGQAAGQSVIAALESALIETQRRALETRLEDAGTAAPMVDWTSMQHETQYTRLFRS